MEETWVVRLENETTFFKHATLRDILNHLGETSTGGEAINVIGIQQGMSSWRVKEPIVPEFVTRCKDAKRKSRRAGLAILYVWLVALASQYLLAEKNFPDKRPKFKGLPRLDRTW